MRPAGLRGDGQLECRGVAASRCPLAPTSARDAHFPSLAARAPGLGKDCGSGAPAGRSLGAGGWRLAAAPEEVNLFYFAP